MKTVNFKAFAKDKIEENALDFLKGGGVDGDGTDILLGGCVLRSILRIMIC